jgi:peroxiredoxin/outer membrane lipoprotein-sorting protein
MRPITLVLVLAAVTRAQDAADIIEKVAAHTRALDSFHAEGTLQAASGVGTHRATAESKLSMWAMDGARKIAIDYKGASTDIQFVTDGSTMWTYLPKQKTYTKVEAAAAEGNEENSTTNAGGDNPALTTYQAMVSRFVAFGKGRTNATLVGEENIKLAGGKVRCWVVRCDFPDRAEKVWVDQQRFLVMRAEFKLSANGQPLEIRADFKRFDLGPVDHGFTLDPPAGAKLVDELEIPGVARQSFIGRPAADFALKNLEGETVRLSELRGKIVVLDFWATWCPPCRHELPTVEKLAAQLRDKNVVVLGINDEGAGTVRNFNRKNNYTFTTLEDTSRRVAGLYQARAIPAVFVINPDGVIVSHLIGGRDESQLLAAIRSAGLEH